EVHMAVQATEPNRILRGNRIDPGRNGKFPAPVLVVPCTANDPFPGLYLVNMVGHSLNELLRGPCIAELYRGEFQPPIDKVGMAIDKSRDHHIALLELCGHGFIS